jgi:hypothetical protein
MQVWRNGRVVGYRSEGCWFAPSLCSLVFRGHRAANVKLRILECFTLYLCNRQSGNLRAIENCICGLRSIERNMRSILRTVWKGESERKVTLHTHRTQNREYGIQNTEYRIQNTHCKNSNRILGFPWNLSFLILENNHCC